jgi:hypothetical protein
MHDSVELILDYADNNNDDSSDSGESVSDGSSDGDDVEIPVQDESIQLGAFVKNSEKKLPRN